MPKATGIKPVLHMEDGYPAEVIARYARENAVDGIVMGTRGKGPLRNIILGSVALLVLLVGSRRQRVR